MDPVTALPKLLGLAWLLPLASFALIVFFGPRMGKAGRLAGYVATGAILASCLLSLVALLGVWIPHYGGAPPVDEAAALDTHGAAEAVHGQSHASADHAASDHGTSHGGHAAAAVKPITGDWYTLGRFGALQITIGYYIDSLTVLMFAMVTFIATCIHFYAYGYMHDELHEVDRPRSDALPTATTCTAAAASTASFNTCRCSASACWASSSRATSRWCSSSGSWSASAPIS